MVIVEQEAKGAGKGPERYARAVAIYMQTAKRSPLADKYGIAVSHYLLADKPQPETKTGERVLAFGARVGGHAWDWDRAQVEMERRSALRSPWSKRSAHHGIISVYSDESLRSENCDQIVQTLAEELGCDTGLILWALHGDTDNVHLHFLIITLDGEGRATPYGIEGKSHEAMQRAIARLEYALDLRPQPGARYEADDDGVRRKPAEATVRPPKRSPIKLEVLRQEDETGVESFTRYAQDVLAPCLDRAQSWDEVQEALARLGARVMKHGSGGEIQSGDGFHKVQLSNVDRRHSWTKLIDRWGEWYEPRCETAEYRPRVRHLGKARKWLEQTQPRDAAHQAVQGRIDSLKSEKAAACAQIREEYSARLADLPDLPGAGPNLSAMKAALRSMRDRSLSASEEAYDSRIEALRELRLGVDEIPDPSAIDIGAIALPDCSLSISWAQSERPIADPPGYRSVHDGESTQYWSASNSRAPAFVERGDRIWINDHSDDAIRAALLVARERYGDVRAYGSVEFIERARQLGADLGIDVQNGAVASSRPSRTRSPRIAQRREAVDIAARMVTRAQQRLLAGMLAEDDIGEPMRNALLERLPGRPGVLETVQRADLMRRGVQFVDPVHSPANIPPTVNQPDPNPRSAPPIKRKVRQRRRRAIEISGMDR